jgi:DNA-directed RNA polymerase specialized sigma24 family protein
MESVVFYMKKSLDMTYHEIAVALNRDDRTIWTVYNRALKKRGDKK